MNEAIAISVILSSITTGLCTLWAGQAGFIGSVLGQATFYFLVKPYILG